MVEELYIIKNGVRRKVDLQSPSGITLNFKSYIFGDITKITCSHSYSFNLPITANNSSIFEMAEDIRTSSSMIRKRLKAIFMQNGIPLFDNANLYLESTTNVYRAVLTWNVIDGMQNLQDNDISLKELSDSSEVTFGQVDDGTENELFDNDKKALFPMYNCGIPYYLWEGYVLGADGHRRSVQRFGEYSGFPMPVVPVYHIIQQINSHFNTKFNLGKHISIGKAGEFDVQREIVEKGVIPLCGADLTYEQRLERKGVLSGIGWTNVNVKITLDDGEEEFKDIITFNSIKINKQDFISPGSFKASKPSSAGTSYNNAGIVCKYDNISLEIDGCLMAGFKEAIQNDEIPTLYILQIQRLGTVYSGGGNSARGTTRILYKWEELASIEGEVVGSFTNGAPAYKFDFASIHGATRLSFDNGLSDPFAYSPIIFKFSHTLGYLKEVDKDIEVFILNSDKNTASHPIDLVSNYPDISCLTFIKSLFYMMGAYPFVDKDGNIVARLFSELNENLQNGKVIDWSDKILNPTSLSSNAEIKYSQSSSYSQKNYYLMKTDELGAKTDPEEKVTDVYADGIGCIEVDNESLSRSQTVIQVPFSAPYIKNNNYPYIDTGETIKVWDLEKNDGKVSRAKYIKKFCHPNPALGIIKDREHGYMDYDGMYFSEGQRMTMEVWNGFREIDKNESFNFLQKIIRNPYVVTDLLLLDEMDLLNLDYTVPVYLTKYNSYFAIISITRDNKGVCKCEMIKLP